MDVGRSAVDQRLVRLGLVPLWILHLLLHPLVLRRRRRPNAPVMRDPEHARELRDHDVAVAGRPIERSPRPIHTDVHAQRVACEYTSAMTLSDSLMTGADPPVEGPFLRYFGVLPPALVIAGAVLVGTILLWHVLPRDGFRALDRARARRGLALAAGAGLGFTALIVTFDSIVHIPNVVVVPPPRSLWFYPLIAIVVEVVFHLLPLSLLLWVTRPLQTRRVWPCIFVTATIEPIFQVLLGAPADGGGWIDVVVGIHVLAINVAQLALFRRRDFSSMLALRLVYYVGWHIVWGPLRPL